MFQSRVVKENQNKYFMFNHYFYFRKSCRLLDKMEKYFMAEQNTDDNMAHEHCVLDN